MKCAECGRQKEEITPALGHLYKADSGLTEDQKSQISGAICDFAITKNPTVTLFPK